MKPSENVHPCKRPTTPVRLMTDGPSGGMECRPMDLARLRQFVESAWQDSIVEQLQAYICIPNKSPSFDPDSERHGYMDQAIELMADWCRAQPVPGMRVEVRRLPGVTPLLLVDVAGELPGCVLLYGHLDKQPEFTGWLPGLGPWEPVLRLRGHRACPRAAPAPRDPVPATSR